MTTQAVVHLIANTLLLIFSVFAIAFIGWALAGSGRSWLGFGLVWFGSIVISVVFWRRLINYEGE